MTRRTKPSPVHVTDANVSPPGGGGENKQRSTHLKFDISCVEAPHSLLTVCTLDPPGTDRRAAVSCRCRRKPMQINVVSRQPPGCPMSSCADRRLTAAGHRQPDRPTSGRTIRWGGDTAIPSFITNQGHEGACGKGRQRKGKSRNGVSRRALNTCKAWRHAAGAQAKQPQRAELQRRCGDEQGERGTGGNYTAARAGGPTVFCFLDDVPPTKTGLNGYMSIPSNVTKKLRHGWVVQPRTMR